MPDAFTQTGYTQQRDAEIQKSWEKQFAKRDGKKRPAACKYCSWHGKQWRRVACVEQVATNKVPTDSEAADTAASVPSASILAEGNPLKCDKAASDRYEAEGVAKAACPKSSTMHHGGYSFAGESAVSGRPYADGADMATVKSVTRKGVEVCLSSEVEIQTLKKLLLDNRDLVLDYSARSSRRERRSNRGMEGAGETAGRSAQKSCLAEDRTGGPAASSRDVKANIEREAKSAEGSRRTRREKISMSLDITMLELQVARLQQENVNLRAERERERMIERDREKAREGDRLLAERFHNFQDEVIKYLRMECQ